MELDTFTIVYVAVILTLMLFTTAFGVWFWKYGKKLVQS